MAVLPINSVSVNANQYTFTGKKDKNSHKANPLASVPVIVMLTMAPMAEGKQPAQFVPIDSEHLTEVLAQANSVAPKAYAYSQTVQHDNSKLDLALRNNKDLRDEKIHHIQKGKMGGRNVYFVFTSIDKNNTFNNVHSIKIVGENLKPDDDPPVINKLIYHDLGAGKEFCGIKILESFYNKEGKLVLTSAEHRIDDTSAQLIIDLLAEDTKWGNSTNIKFSETTSSALEEFKVISIID